MLQCTNDCINKQSKSKRSKEENSSKYYFSQKTQNLEDQKPQLGIKVITPLRKEYQLVYDFIKRESRNLKKMIECTEKQCSNENKKNFSI